MVHQNSFTDKVPLKVVIQVEFRQLVVDCSISLIHATPLDHLSSHNPKEFIHNLCLIRRYHS